jgi:rSAM/selenodomain-associated transferase 1
VTRIVIFAKAPVPGKVKTRLIPALGPEGAAALAQRMLLRTIAEAEAAGSTELCGSPHPHDAEWQPYLPAVPIRHSGQGEGDLGERLARAAERVLADEPILLIGADCPELDRDRLRAAAAALGSHDAVIHPAQDGGYALLGLKRFDPSIFAGIAWSTSEVASQTLQRLALLGWSVHVGDTLRDIDEPEDLGVLFNRHSSENWNLD